jgi:hypothetical protein
MIERVAGFRLSKNLLFGVACVVLGGGAVAIYLDRQGLSYKELIVGVGALIVAIIVFGGERGIRFGLVLWVLTLALGYRTVELTPNLRLHPSEILIWVLLAFILVQRHLDSNTRLLLPWWLGLLMPFWVLAWWPLIVGDAPWDKMLNEFRDFLLLVPLIIVASVVLQRKSYWRQLLLAFFIASTWIALMGIVEYSFPNVENLFPAFIHAAKPMQAADGFVRAQFSFWGGSQATFICVLALPGGLALATWWPRSLPRLAIVVASVLQILAIYIGGYRSVWLVLLIQVVIACLLRVKKHGVAIALLCVIVGAVGYQFIPKTDERVISGIAALKGAPIDHSAQDRKDRAFEAIQQTIESPFGSGWNSAGWVHSDFLQVAANLGIIAGLIFLGGYLYTLQRLMRRMLPWLRITGQGDLALALFLSFIAAGAHLAVQGVEVLPQLVLPVWFVWVLVEVWLQQTPDLRKLYAAPITAYPNQIGDFDYRPV